MQVGPKVNNHQSRMTELFGGRKKIKTSKLLLPSLSEHEWVPSTRVPLSLVVPTGDRLLRKNCVRTLNFYKIFSNFFIDTRDLLSRKFYC